MIRWYMAHQLDVHLALVLLWAAVSAVLNALVSFALRLQPLQDWVTVAERKPRLAALVRMLGAVGIQPIQFAQALVDLIRGTASKGTISSAKTLQVSSSAPLISPPVPKKDEST